MDNSDKPNVNRDHDLIVTVNVKLDALTTAVKDLKDDLFSRVTKVEARLDQNDVFHAAIPLKEYEEIAAWAKNLRANIKFMMVAAGVLFTIISIIIGKLVEKWFPF